MNLSNTLKQNGSKSFITIRRVWKSHARNDCLNLLQLKANLQATQSYLALLIFGFIMPVCAKVWGPKQNAHSEGFMHLQQNKLVLPLSYQPSSFSWENTLFCHIQISHLAEVTQAQWWQPETRPQEDLANMQTQKSKKPWKYSTVLWFTPLMAHVRWVNSLSGKIKHLVSLLYHRTRRPF